LLLYEFMAVTSKQVQDFLNDELGINASEVAVVGAGAWSKCFGFRQGNDELVVRFGQHLDDFEKDKFAYTYTSATLPIPKVLDIGQAFGGYYAMSTRVHGVPLEQLSAKAWLAVVPSLVSALEAMRLADVSGTSGFGSWKSEGNGVHASWSHHLLEVRNDRPQQRTHGWLEKLATSPSPEGEKAFVWGMDLLEQLASDAVPRSVVHCDLSNRNVLVGEGKLSGVFDWGCALYGDHLYDLAWLEFWSPWHPELDIDYLKVELEQRWVETGYTPQNKDSRLLACHLHIGLSHLAYNAHLDDWETLLATAERMRRLAVKP
jgi:hygromycin-B 4-O-kinase